MPESQKEFLIKWVVQPVLGALIVFVFFWGINALSGGTPLKMMHAVVISDIEELKRNDIEGLKKELNNTREILEGEINDNESKLNFLTTDNNNIKRELHTLTSSINPGQTGLN
ncbi:MAG: hypothetical protein HRT38_17520 [Alteromonadaceae bacterium]|nr:hypothetical protein [Alteromonadaceae bacterium]